MRSFSPSTPFTWTRTVSPALRSGTLALSCSASILSMRFAMAMPLRPRGWKFRNPSTLPKNSPEEKGSGRARQPIQHDRRGCPYGQVVVAGNPTDRLEDQVGALEDLLREAPAGPENQHVGRVAGRQTRAKIGEGDPAVGVFRTGRDQQWSFTGTALDL